MIDLAVFLKQRGYKPRQVQDFIPAPMDIATCMYYAGLDPMTMKPVETVKKLKDREVQRALMQFFKPENYFAVRRALLDAGRLYYGQAEVMREQLRRKDLSRKLAEDATEAAAARQAWAARRAMAERAASIRTTTAATVCAKRPRRATTGT